jgi:hypothetical protein
VGLLALVGAAVRPQDEGMAAVSARDDAGIRARFPEVRGRSLLGLEMTLPRDLPAEITLVVVAFLRGQQEQVDRWIARAVAAGIPPTPRGTTGLMPVAVVEVPVLSTAWRPARRFIDGGMTAGIGDPDVLARTITVYTNVAAFQRSLAIPDSDDVHALVVRRDGVILARGDGDPDDDRWEAIRAVLPAG